MAIITAIFVTHCRPANPEEFIKGVWNVTKCSTPLANSATTDPVKIFRFYEDGTYSQFGAYASFGIWRYNKADTILYLHPTIKGSEVLDSYFHIDNFAASTMQLTLYRNLPAKQENAELIISMNAGSETSDMYDPYRLELHQWRLKPQRPETDQQIKSRVKAYLNFLKTWYRYAIKNKFESLSISWYPNPMLMHYANGIRLAYSDELYDWNNCFYDSAQAVKGYMCISGPFQNIKLKNTADKLERNLDCIEQLLQMTEK